MKRILLVLGVLCATCVVSCSDDEPKYDENGELIPVEKKSPTALIKTIGQYALGIGGVGLLLISVTKTFGGLSYPAARHSLIHLLRTNPNQAEMVARGMQGTFGEAIGAAMKTAAMVGTPDPVMIASTTMPTYDGTAQGIASRWGQLITKGKLYVAAALGGFVLGLTSGGFPIISFALALIAVGCFIRVFTYKNEIESTIVRARHEMLPEVDRAMSSGRYAFPPPKR
ncbi:MAG: hypothetical protein H0T42_34265 [Deltaproteobacteria bacterium]|nr:hypothetical protein [Deltaproteobacteria bacterium]